MKYEITVFSPADRRLEEVLKFFKEDKKYLHYYELIGCNLLNVLPNSYLKVVNTSNQEDYIREKRFFLKKYDTVGATTQGQCIDTSMCVTNLKTGEYFYVDYQDGPIHTVDFVQNDKCIGIFTPQHKHVYRYMSTDTKIFKYSHKFFPLGFFPRNPYLLLDFREEVQRIRKQSKLIPKMFFSGNFYKDTEEQFNPRKNIYERSRMVVEILNEKYKEWIDIVDRSSFKNSLSIQDYLKKVASYALPLAVPGHPWSHREQEFWGVGIPTLSNTYTCSLLEPLLPNIHYIDAGTTGKDYRDREVDCEKAADLLYNRFKEVYKNYEYLHFISSNILKRYDNFQDTFKTAKKLIDYIKYIHSSF